MKKYIITALIAASAGLGANAQSYSAYFIDNYLYRHEMNPAFGNESSYFGIPGIGNLSIGAQGNVHLSKFIYNLNGETVLFTNPGLSDSEVGSFKEKNRLGLNTKINFINFGFKAFGGYNTVGINAVATGGVAVPGSLLNLLRDGVENKTYDIKNFMGNANAYAEIALNHSRDIKQVPGLRVGATFKFLIGAGNMDARFNTAELILDQKSWDIRSEADVYASVKGLKWKKDFNETANRHYVSGVELDDFSAPNGFGAAIDLGATYDWNDFQFSLGILDIGGIRWNKTQHASTNGLKEFKTSDHTFDINDDDEKSTWDEIEDDLSALYQLEDMGESGSRSTMLGTTLNIGADYKFPYYKNLKFGLLNTTRIAGEYSWTEFRLSANVTPVKCLSAGVNLAAGTFGVGFGWIVNLNTGKGINLFLGMDKTPGKFTKQFAPLNSNATFNFGLNVVL